MRSQGKLFEEDFKKSFDLNDENLFYYRFKDGTANWNSNNQNNFIRFQAKNICDNMIFYKGKLILCELKTHKGKSLPLSCIRESQFKEMCSVDYKKNVFPMIIILFLDVGECYALKMTFVNRLIAENKVKSISLLACRENGLKIDCRINKTRYRFNTNDFLENLEKYYNNCQF